MKCKSDILQILSVTIMCFICALLNSFFSSNEILAVSPMLIAGIAQAGIGAFQYFDQKEKQRQLDLKAEGYVKQMRQQLKQLKNPFAALQVATKKEELIGEKGLQTDANVVQALQEGDPSMMLGGASNVVRAQTDRNLNLMAGLDEKEAATALKRAEGEKWLQETQASGEMGILEKQMEGTNLDRQVAGETMNLALSGITAGLTNVASGAIEGADLYPGGGGGEDKIGGGPDARAKRRQGERQWAREDKRAGLKWRDQGRRGEKNRWDEMMQSGEWDWGMGSEWD